MKFTDDFTSTPEAAEAFESGRAYQMTRRELADEAGYEPDAFGPTKLECPEHLLAALDAATRERDRLWAEQRERRAG